MGFLDGQVLRMGVREWTEAEIARAPETVDSRLDPEKLAREVGIYYAVSAKAIFSRRRTKDVAAARTSFCKRLREAGWSYGRIAKLLGRDHTTIVAIVQYSGQEEYREKRRARTLARKLRLAASPPHGEDAKGP